MKKYLILFIPLLLTLSCTKEKNYPNNASLDSDDLGQKEFRFGDSIITDESDNGYELAYYSTGFLDFIIAPQSKAK